MDEFMELNDDGDAQVPKRRRMSKRAYDLLLGPRFRPNHITRYQATNTQIIEAENDGNIHTFWDHVVDDTAQGGVHIYTGTDVQLSEWINPNSPKLISIRLEQVDALHENIAPGARIPIPLYLNFTDKQMEEIRPQLGLAVSDPRNELDEDVSLIVMNVGLARTRTRKICGDAHR